MLIVFLFCDSTNNVAKVVARFSANILFKVFIERALSVRKAFEAIFFLIPFPSPILVIIINSFNDL